MCARACGTSAARVLPDRRVRAVGPRNDTASRPLQKIDIAFSEKRAPQAYSLKKDADASATHAPRRGRPRRRAFGTERPCPMSSKRTKASDVALAEQLIAGTNKHLSTTTQVLVAGKTFTPVQITAQLEALVSLRRDVDASKAITKAKLAAEKTDMPALRTFQRAFVTFVKAAYGTTPDALADFGLQPPKPPTPPTVLAKAAAAAKRKATRAARHTMGIVQRLPLRRGTRGIPLKPSRRAASAASL